jgi:Fic family protein
MKSFTKRQLEIEIPLGLSWLLGSVMEYKGKEELFSRQKPEVLKTLLELALVQSAESSNRIEGITVDPKRLRPLVLKNAQPKDRSEEEVIGYRKALNWIHTKQSSINLTPETLQKLHRFSQGGSGDAGQWKKVNNDIIQIFSDGHREVLFHTVSVKETEEATRQLCLAYQHVCEQSLLPPLLSAGSCVLDFLCIHPFRDGNGRVSRLLTLFLLYKHGYQVGKYISLERVVEENKENYYNALHQSSQLWHQGTHSVVPWWSFFLSSLKLAYKEFESRTKQYESSQGGKSQVIEAAIVHLPDEFRATELEALCPSVSRDSVRLVLRKLRDSKDLECSSQGRGAIWKKVGKMRNK